MDRFSEIGRFRNVVTGVSRYSYDNGKSLPTYDYVGTVKLHGSNGGIRRTPSGKIVPQSRKRILDVSSDNYGFAMFVESNRDAIKRLFDEYFTPDQDVTLYGEWCGEGIQSNVALALLPKHFVIFNYKIKGVYEKDGYPISSDMHDNDAGIYNIFQIPHYEVTVNFVDPNNAIHEMNELTDAIDNACPWGEFRGVTGHGEGLVWVPRQFPEISDLWFKTKGGKHSGKPKVKGIKAKMSVEEANTIAECLLVVLPEWRLQQGITHLKEEHYLMEPSSIGPYLKWVSQDVLKEELDTIVENGLEWKSVHKAINRRARQYFLDYMNSDGLNIGEG
jgi:hypothetical protein